MYADTITLFNRAGDKWYPTVVAGVDFNGDRASLLAKYGESCADAVKLHVKLFSGKIAGKQYVQPKEWKSLADRSGKITVAERDFFCIGGIATAATISDSDYAEGFYNYMNQQRDDVYIIQSVARYSVIPHLEILAR